MDNGEQLQKRVLDIIFNYYKKDDKMLIDKAYKLVKELQNYKNKKKNNPTVYIKHNEFSKLPESQPYSFTVFPAGEFIIITEPYFHNDVLDQYDMHIDTFFKKGGVQMYYFHNNNTYSVVGLFKNTNSKTALKTAKDICLFYNCEPIITDATQFGFS